MARHVLSLIFAAMLLTAVTACAQWKGGPFARLGRAISSDDESTWEPRVVRLRVYPSSGLVQDGQTTLLETRIELLDDMGDSLKASGHYHFDLTTALKSGVVGSGDRLYSWDVAVLTRKQQIQFYDPITRAYLFRLKLDEPVDPQLATVLRLTLTKSDGQQLTIETPLAAMIGVK